LIRAACGEIPGCLGAILGLCKMLQKTKVVSDFSQNVIISIQFKRKELASKLKAGTTELTPFSKMYLKRKGVSSNHADVPENLCT
jgi:hypothetical protein